MDMLVFITNVKKYQGLDVSTEHRFIVQLWGSEVQNWSH